jgi:hypothetical protein
MTKKTTDAPTTRPRTTRSGVALPSAHGGDDERNGDAVATPKGKEGTGGKQGKGGRYVTQLFSCFLLLTIYPHRKTSVQKLQEESRLGEPAKLTK